MRNTSCRSDVISKIHDADSFESFFYHIALLKDVTPEESTEHDASTGANDRRSIAVTSMMNSPKSFAFRKKAVSTMPSALPPPLSPGGPKPKMSRAQSVAI